ncbi:MAG: Rieske (2Fe-2S) protein [Planctomycetales bacterium]|nr:Rieske (2Fe-2S) protein [Planctomycetales bacterium]
MAWLKLGAVAEVAVGTAKEFLVDGRVVAIFHTTDGIFATDGMCAHQGGPLANGMLDGKCITCPWHGWQYDVSTGNNLLTKKQMLDCYEVELRNEEIWLSLP